MEYNKHEFVKMTEVGKMIQEASSQMMDKVHLERKMNIQNKNMIKTLEFQHRKLESEV
jgi:hypothetical protein